MTEERKRNMMKDKINIGVIGCGSIARTHLHYLTSRNDIALGCVCDVIEERAKQFCNEFGAKRYVLDYRDLLSDRQIDVVLVTVPQGLHAEVVIMSAQSGKHIFCEKPMAMTVAECQAMRKAVEKTGVILQIGYVLRFSPNILKVKEWLGLIGRPALFRDVWAPSPWASPHPWVFDKTMGGGPLYEASHWIDFMNFLFGKPKKVYASMHHFKPGSFTAPDTFLLLVDYEAGDRALWSDAECVPGFGNFYVRHSATRPSLSIIGPHGSIHFPAPDGTKVLSLYLNHLGPQPVETHPWETDWGATGQAYRAELDYFIECVKEGRRPSINTGEDGEWVIQVIEAALRSHETGQPVELPLHVHPVNSREWRNEYFVKHWDANKGSEQTKHYMQVILSNLPTPELVYLRANHLRILNWGCAFGEGVALLAKSFPKSEVTGLDFAPKAIEEAQRRHPNLKFVLTQQGEIPNEFDVIITSHTLEHLENPLQKAKEHLRFCKDLYIVLVPYDEYPLPEYHRAQFREESFPERLGSFVRIHTQVVGDEHCRKQLLAVYGSHAYLQKRPEIRVRVEEERSKWDRYYASLPLLEEDDATKTFNREFVHLVSELVAPNSRILEAGCGAGWQSLALARLGKYNINLMDCSQEALNYAERLFERENAQAHFIHGDVFEPGEPEYDLVFNAGVLEHYTFDQQVAFLKGMASRSRKYVLVLVPNRLCYWYWLWRVQKSGEGKWPFGKETPLVDLSPIFEAAGLQFLGQMFLGETWTESFINSFDGLDQRVRSEILAIHRSTVIPKAMKSYLIAALGSVTTEPLLIPECWKAPAWKEDVKEAEIYAALGDALALRIGADRRVQALQARLAEVEEAFESHRKDKVALEAEVAQLRAQLSERDQVVQALQARLAEKEQLLHKIYTSRGFKLLAKIWEVRGAWKRGPKNFAWFIARKIYRRLPVRAKKVVKKVYFTLYTRLLNRAREPIKQPASQKKEEQASQNVKAPRRLLGKVYIVSPSPFDVTGQTAYIGGAERYLLELARLIQRMGYEVEVYQPGLGDWFQYFYDIPVYGLDTGGSMEAMNEVFHRRVHPPDLTIYLAFWLAAPRCFQPSIGISHGIYWDNPAFHSTTTQLHDTIEKVCKPLENLACVVSVDTNTINWVRTVKSSLTKKFVYIPNFVDTETFRPRPASWPKDDNSVVILYPRRLYAPRGFYLLQEVIPPLIAKYPHVIFLLAGQLDTEKEREAVEAMVRAYPDRVHWQVFPLERMHEAYWSADIAVIPTLFAEGTSLACLEAMACGNAVVATHVGGLTDLIIHGYNGLLVAPAAEALQQALERLIEDKSLRTTLSIRARETAQVFSLSQWQREWEKVLRRFLPARSIAASTRPCKPPRVIVMENPNPITWKRMRQRPHAIAEQLAQRGWTVFWKDASHEPAMPRPNLHIVPPDFETPEAPQFIYLYYPYDYEKVAGRQEAIIIYDILDDISIHDPSDDWVKRPLGQRARDYYERLLQRADIVVTSSRTLYDSIRAVRPDVVYVPNGVDLSHFYRFHVHESNAPPDIAGLPRPRVGFHGAIADWLDVELLRALISGAPEWAFVFVGPVSYELFYALQQFPNCHYLGEKPPELVPLYVAAFDVGILPFQINAVTRAVRPLKALEYLAAGCPVVATPLPEIQEWPYVLLATDAASFQQALRHALTLREDMARDPALSRFLMDNDWAQTVRPLLWAMYRHLLRRWRCRVPSR